jgi:SAM-dependent methyltransferase
MRLAAHAENLVERIMLALGLIPTPFLETHAAMILSRAVAVATRVGIFEALATGPEPASTVAHRCGTAERATAKLLEAMTGAGYLRRTDGVYSLRRKARRWLLAGKRWSLHDQMTWQLTEWDWLTDLDRFLSDGVPVDIHGRLSERQWADYQRGMRSMAGILAPEVAWRTRVPAGARDMLDIGGSHGHYSVALCRRHPRLRSVVLELPQALSASAALLSAEDMGDRVTHRPGNVLDEDLGVDAWDVVFMSQLAHHFDEATNRRLAERVARALRPGGVFVIQDLLRPEDGGPKGQLAGLYDLFFALTSAVGTWSAAEMAGWQRAAGLSPVRSVRFVTAPGMGQQVAVKEPVRVSY